MKREYSTPKAVFEAYELTSQIAGACTDAGKDPVTDLDPVTINGVVCRVHEGENFPANNCSKGQHHVTLETPLVVFADGNPNGGPCNTDVYSEAALVKLFKESVVKVSGDGEIYTTPGGIPYMHFRGESENHVGVYPLPYGEAFYS